MHVKQLVDDIREKQSRATDDVRKLREENDRLKKELKQRLTEDEVLRRFRGYSILL